MRTKEDERKLVDTFDQTTVSIKSESRPLFAELIKATEEYQKTLAQTAFAGNKLAEVMKRVVAISPDPEMNRGLEDVAEIVGTHEKQNDDFSRFVLESIVLPMRMHQDDEKKTLPEFIKNAKAQRKASKKAVQNAEAATKKAGKKGGAELQNKITELNQRMQEAQQQLSEQLKEALQRQRRMFCLYMDCWSGAFAIMQGHHEAVDKRIGEELELLRQLGASAETISATQIDLVKERKRTFINLAGLSAEWKKIFKDAGISPSDFRNEETARLILDTLERAGVNTSSLTSDSFAAIGDAAPADDLSPSTPSEPSEPDHEAPGEAPPATPRRTSSTRTAPRSRPPPPPVRTTSSRAAPSGAPPPPPVPRESPPPTPTRTGPPAPAAPRAPPPPPPPARDADAPPPTPSRAGGPPNLLSQIQQGTRLRAVAERPAGEAAAAAMPEASNFDSADLTTMLRKAMGARRVAVKESGQDDEDDEDWGDDEEDEWSD